ncbi:MULTISPECIES: 2-hydroxyacid dehydrogenase [Mycobacterium avium complex (MAC)]|uniref:Hydroxyacid dehydrogenase n=1 Tax=Mycobacterium avium subsp. hominissuis TaxID=439334 RepID=A0AAI8WXP9_MYCAV|nr:MULTISPECIES: 2-hydroxyacid dehydrogenase [Mycobacterium avium complex (MAC)]APT09018.1 hydroxyacid dehydrogenase [Mycobacterium avium subsp. hominissuis]ETZ58358.1 D-isomer specific 2-hydroxyacid dehydrogenase, catalytic domain protein [Mycobacterium sp. MAC_011194_8550]ETZ59338.1 D-isomer specific 2-hydroxyacid dehydrogenase, catalytic domain protein [Mycobacterium sp. MAC_080597_8934]KDP11708.1 hydroxyacid dehydrogenase [Mycobacterium avium subsp. hominissuis 100]MBZ4572137.1 2-hydroxyac
MAVTKLSGVFRVGELEPAFAEELAARYDVPRLPDGAARDRFLAEHAAEVRALLTWGRPGVDAALIAALPNLEVIVNNGAGVDLIETAAADRRGIGVSNTPDVLSDTVADTALGLILMTLRRLGAADRYVRAGRWAREGPFPYGRDVSGLQVGILGLGRIGSAIATRLRGFDCAIAYHNRRRIDGSPYRYAASAVELAESVDVLVVATTGDHQAHKLVDRAVLRALGPEGYLINIARGSVVDQEALVEMLAGGELAGAGLDVFADEPHVPAELVGLDNVVLLPHVGSATARTRRAMASLALRNLDSYLATGQLVTPVLRPRRRIPDRN